MLTVRHNAPSTKLPTNPLSLHNYMNTILGIDPSLNSTGWAIVEQSQDKFKLIKHGLIKMNKSLSDVVQKIEIISLEIDKILLENPSITSIAMEETFSNLNPSSSLKLGMVRGAIIAIAGKNKVESFQYLPKVVKQAITGRGNAEKQQVAYMVKSILSIKEENFQTFDITDAISVAIAHQLIKNSPLLQYTISPKT